MQDWLTGILSIGLIAIVLYSIIDTIKEIEYYKRKKRHKDASRKTNNTD